MFLLFLFIFEVSLIPNSHSACTITKPCLHNGSFNINTCTCDCINTAYIGDQCQFSNCDNQPSICLSIDSKVCTDAIIANYCPLKCQQVICKCGFDSCLNGGVFSPSTCTCACSPQYTGIRCETLISTTTATTTTSVNKCIQQLPCLNGGKQNQVTCSCECTILI